MTIDECIGQRIMVGFEGTTLSPEVVSLINDKKVGNIILFRDNITDREQLKKLCRDIQELVLNSTGHPAFIGVDQEGGVVYRLPADCASMPGAMAIAATGSLENARECGRITARELHALGVNMNFAPDADINNNIDNPIIGCRSFGDTPEEVADLSMANLEGYLEEGLLAVAKHFPGHGDTAADSHVSLPLIDKTVEELESMELIPFKRLIDKGCPGIMTTHILFPRIEEERIPGTMSRRIVTGLLRERLGFEGMIISDCMEMDAISKYYGTDIGVATAMAAGVDMVIISHTTGKALDAIEKLKEYMEDGLISKEDMEDSAKRILAFKQRFAASKEHVDNVDWKEFENTARRVRQESITLYKGNIPTLGQDPLFIGCKVFQSGQVSNPEDTEDSFPGVMAERLGGKGWIVSKDPQAQEIQRAVAEAGQHSAIIMNSYNGHLYPGSGKLVKALSELGIPMAVVALRNPYDLRELPENCAGIAAWDYSSMTLDILVEVISGRLKPCGKMPIKL